MVIGSSAIDTNKMDEEIKTVISKKAMQSLIVKAKKKGIPLY